MAYKRDRKIKAIIDYCKSCGIDVHTSTEARGHQGVFLHSINGITRIDISKKLPQERFIPVIAHEFTHFFHHSLDKPFESLKEIFGIKDEILLEELELVTDFVSGNIAEVSIKQEITKIKQKILEYEDVIRKTYPNFKRTTKFTEFERYIKNSDARYLLKYDRVKVLNWLKYKIYSIENLKEDFPELPKAYAAYINLRALQRQQQRYSRRLRKLKNYYSQSSELFARFVEGLVIDREKVRELAPKAYEAFAERLEYHSFKKLKELLEIIDK